jgi:hypothetical protein
MTHILLESYPNSLVCRRCVKLHYPKTDFDRAWGVGETGSASAETSGMFAIEAISSKCIYAPPGFRCGGADCLCQEETLPVYALSCWLISPYVQIHGTDPPQMCQCCDKQALFVCTWCSGARYCGMICREAHWTVHLPDCCPNLD